MSLEKVIQLVFSPTGNTAKIADEICKGIGFEVEVIDLADDIKEQEIENGSIVVAAFPVFGGRIPPLMVERLKRIKASGNNAVAVVVYGNRAFDDALLELKDILTEIGCKVMAGGAFIAEHSIIRDVAAGRPCFSDLEAAAKFGKKIAIKIENDDIREVSVPGHTNYKNKKPMGGFVPTADSSCNNCGKCVKSCPVNAISIENPKATSKSCIGCMRCVAICPVHARKLPDTIIASAEMMLSLMAQKRRKPETFF